MSYLRGLIIVICWKNHKNQNAGSEEKDKIHNDSEEKDKIYNDSEEKDKIHNDLAPRIFHFMFDKLLMPID